MLRRPPQIPRPGTVGVHGDEVVLNIIQGLRLGLPEGDPSTGAPFVGSLVEEDPRPLMGHRQRHTCAVHGGMSRSEVEEVDE